MSSYDEGYETGFNEGLAEGQRDAVPPGLEPMPWCEQHDAAWEHSGGCLNGWVSKDSERCKREPKVRHWVTKDTT